MNKTILIVLLLLLWPILISAQRGAVTFSRQGGFYEESFNLSLSCTAGHQIRYTTNGNTPTINSTLYVGPLFLNEDLYSKSNIYTIVNAIPSTFYVVENVKRSIIIRAAAFDENDSCVSPVVTQTYLIRSLGCDLHGLPVVSIAADSLALFDYETGIFVPGANFDPADMGTGNYMMKGREWERQINVEFYEPDNSGINQLCGLRTHGGASRKFQQKGMRLYAREEYGKKRFKHHFFEAEHLASFKHLNLHPFRCSNWWQTGGQEYLSQRVAAQMDVDGLNVRQVVVFINGEYWGIYTLEESPDERYLEDHYGVDLEQVNILKYWSVLSYGNSADWWRFRTWIETADLNQPEDLAYAFLRMDVSNLIDYYLLEVYGANLDWPQNNVLQWQAREGEPFRMMFYDGDGCFTHWYYQAMDHSLHSDINILIINKFMESDTFRTMCYNRYLELKSTVFRYSALKSIWNEYRDIVEDEVPSQVKRFGFPKDVHRWQVDMDSVEVFFAKRAQAFNQELQKEFAYNESFLHDVTVYPNPNNGVFFMGVTSDKCILLTMEIYNVMGQRVHSEDSFLTPGYNVFKFRANLPSGFYLLKAGSIVKRIIIQ